MRAFILIALCSLLLLASCAGPNTAAHTPDARGHIAGFWGGLLDGLISPVTFFISLVSRNTHFYEVHNNGNWYNIGFALGAVLVLGSSGAASRQKS